MKSQSKLLTDLSAGADPEVFIIDRRTGVFTPSLDLIGGTKNSPRATSAPGFFVQEDNVLGEYNIPPAKTEKEFCESIRIGLKLFEECLPKEYGLQIATSHKFDPTQLLDPRAQEFGCDPDFNAWRGGLRNTRPEVPTDGLRTAGGHFHLGYSLNPIALQELGNESLRQSDVNVEIVKWQDLFAGVPSMIMDKDTERRKLYGKAGAFRNKSYGLEYRTLSSFWLASDELVSWLYSQMMRAVDKINSYEFLSDDDGAVIQKAINGGDKNSIQSLVEKYELSVI